MNEALFELAEYLADHLLITLRGTRRNTDDPGPKGQLSIEIIELQNLLDKARHEQKGGS